MESKQVAPFLMGKFMNINGDLRNKITVDNNSFIQQYERHMASKTADAIRRRYNDKRRVLTESKTALDSMLHVSLINLIFHLHSEKKIVFCDWVTLNQAIYDELGVDSGGLRTISQDKNNLIYKELETSFKPGFLNMSPKDEASLDVHKRTFKEEKRRYCIVAFALKTFSDDIQNWKPAHSAI